MNYGIVFLPIGVYGKSGMSEWLWKYTKLSNSVIDHSLSESKVLGLSLTCYKWYLNYRHYHYRKCPTSFAELNKEISHNNHWNGLVKRLLPKTEKEIGYVIFFLIFQRILPLEGSTQKLKCWFWIILFFFFTVPPTPKTASRLG